MGGKLSTGIGALDRQLSGGLDPGDVLAIVAPPATQSQTLLYQLMDQRPTLYVTSQRPEASVERDIEKRGGVEFPYQVASVGEDVSMDSEVVRELTGSRTFTANTAMKEDPLDDLYDLTEAVKESTNVIVDPTTPFERGESRGAYNEVLSKLSVKMQRTDGLAVLYCHNLNKVPPFRDTTLSLADVVWQVNIESTGKKDVEHKLRVPKNRGGPILTEELSLDIGTRDVHIDDSRTI